MLVVIDYGMGNLHSVQKALKRIGVESKVSCSENDIETADKLILPGVGHFKNGMENLKRSGLDSILNKKVMQDKIPILGICLGMQLFTRSSKEGNAAGFGWINAETVKFNVVNDKEKIKVPHMGWNNLSIKKSSYIAEEITSDDQFYFVHSYFVKCNNATDVLSTTNYGIEFVSSFQCENITGVQFHPEKSHSSGLKILNRFCKL